LIGGLIIAAIENSKVGQIMPGPALDSPTDEKIKMLMANKVAVGELGHASDPNIAATAHAPAAAPAEMAGASAEVQTMAGSSPTAPVAGTAATVLPTASTAVANPPMASLAQGVASQMGCGAVKADGEAAYVAPCGSYDVYIGCDTGQCRPLHTIKLEVDR
jgi:hypothetical protein